MSTYYPSFASLAEQYDAFILDLWGVIHDGLALYPGVRECLNHLRSCDKKIVFLSNAPRRASVVIAGLERFGIPASQYDAAMSSGEAGFHFLKNTNDWGKRYYFIGPDRDAGVLEGLDYVRVPTIAGCDFILNAGFGTDDEPMSTHEPVIAEGLKHNKQMLCINPDFEVVRITGARALCAGAIAEEYEKRGGSVKYFGKPFPEVYATCFDILAGVSKSRILAVGDNLHTDIAGAKHSGIDSALVLGGMLKDRAPLLPWKEENRPILDKLCTEHHASPTYLLPAFNW